MLKNYLFLLGGHDLEMITIRDMLSQHRLNFIDRNLLWGASWSDYQDVIDTFDWEQGTIIGIELSGMKPPLARQIDHHNELAHLPASLQQVASLLNIPLTRQQLLIAANDRGYIPAMRKMGATEEEIQQIRRLDRKAQGVTDVMEEVAENDIQSINTCNGVAIINTNLTKFSPIADRLSVPRLLIYNLSELTYYGEDAASLRNLFTKEVATGRMFYGGGVNGYFGVGPGYYTPEAIRQFVDTICTYFKEHYESN